MRELKRAGDDDAQNASSARIESVLGVIDASLGRVAREQIKPLEKCEVNLVRDEGWRRRDVRGLIQDE